MDGLILIDKPANYTSRDIVNIVGKKFKTKRVGHTGTLDPLATGLLVVAINNGLKVVNLLTSDTKEYVVEVEAGILTDTLDVTGKTLEIKEKFTLKKDEILKVINSFIGNSVQEVPIFSAVKVNGKKLYNYARNGEKVELPKKEITIYDIKLLEVKEKTFSFIVTVSKGTYIRSLVRDIGNKLNIPCSMKNLKRTKAGIFKIEDANRLEDIDKENIILVSIDEALSLYPKVIVDDEFKKQILNGVIIDNTYNKEIIVFKDTIGNVLAIYQKYHKDCEKMKPLKVFNL